MPLLSGKSKKAFSHNVGAEMDAGKPQRQALAIAYSMKRKAQKKAKGGMINEDLNPKANDLHEAEDEMMDAGEHISHEAQSHEVLPEPMEPEEDMEFAQDEDSKPHFFMKKGGMIHAIMRKMADGGMISHYDEGGEATEPGYPATGKLINQKTPADLKADSKRMIAKGPSYAEGGMVEDDDFLSADDWTDDMIMDPVTKKKKREILIAKLLQGKMHSTG